MTRLVLVCSIVLAACQAQPRAAAPSCNDPLAPGDAALARSVQQLEAAGDAAAAVAVGQQWVRVARTRGEPAHYARARACAERALAHSPDDVGAQQLLGLTLLN